MKVFNLSCRKDHRFEGWFASAEAYDQQLARQLIECPTCGSHDVQKMLAAPRLNLSQKPAPQRAAGRPTVTAREPVEAHGKAMDPQRAQAMFMTMIRRVLDSTEDVGDRFAEEARKIHYSEAPERAIRGNATPEEAADLQDEGIEVVALPIPRGMKGPLQ